MIAILAPALFALALAVSLAIILPGIVAAIRVIRAGPSS